MRLLAFETSCDETSVAVIDGGRVLANVVASQVSIHQEYGGVVPELAAREHLRQVLPIAHAALRHSSTVAGDLDGLVATQGPGLPSALMTGLRTAQVMAFALRRPFLGVHHHEAHLYSPWIEGTPGQARFDAFEPNVSLIVSGGHTMLVHVAGELQHHVLGSTLDDAAGECFDKVGKMLGLPYPAGPTIDRLAAEGNPAAFSFPRPMMTDPGHDFSFSGLKTSVRYFLRDRPGLAEDRQRLADLCASVQAAIVEVLVTKTIAAAKKMGVRCVTASGGVTCNKSLRRELAGSCSQWGLRLRLAQPEFCTDNAAMIGILGERKLLLGRHSSGLDEDIRPDWRLS